MIRTEILYGIHHVSEAIKAGRRKFYEVYIAKGKDTKGLADMPVYSCDLSCPIALVIGSEGKGIRQLVKENCDFLVSIPQKSYVSSLNASAARAVAMYEAFRQRNFTGPMAKADSRY